MITVIAGYPGSGKSTWARRMQMERGGAVLDLDGLVAEILGAAAHSKAAADANVIRTLNGLMWKMAERLDGRGTDVYIIRTAPNETEMSGYVLFSARVLMEREKEACRAAAMARPDWDPEGFEAACAAVDRMLGRHRGNWRRVRLEED